MKNEIVVIKPIPFDPAVIFTETDSLESLLKEVESQALSHVPVLDTAKGRKDIASVAAKVAKSKTFIDGLGKDLVAADKARIKKTDNARKMARDFLDDLKKRVRQPLDEWESAEKERVERHLSNLESMKSLAVAVSESGEPYTSETLKGNLSSVEALKIDSSWDEFVEEAAIAKDSAVAFLKNAIEIADKREAEAKELERLRKEADERAENKRLEAEAKAKKEREDRIAKEAAERATREAEAKVKAEKAEAERKIREAEERERKYQEEIKAAKISAQQAAERVERERIEAVKAAEAKAKAEAERKEQERIAKEKAEKEAAERKAANARHQANVQKKAIDAFVANSFAREYAEKIVRLIHEGKIDGISMDY